MLLFWGIDSNQITQNLYLSRLELRPVIDFLRQRLPRYAYFFGYKLEFESALVNIVS